MLNYQFNCAHLQWSSTKDACHFLVLAGLLSKKFHVVIAFMGALFLVFIIRTNTYFAACFRDVLTRIPWSLQNSPPTMPTPPSSCRVWPCMDTTTYKTWSPTSGTPRHFAWPVATVTCMVVVLPTTKGQLLQCAWILLMYIWLERGHARFPVSN